MSDALILISRILHRPCSSFTAGWRLPMKRLGSTSHAFVDYLLFVDFSAHNFWDIQGAARGALMAHFYKNLAIMGGFLLLALQCAERYSLDGQMPRSWILKR